MTPIAVYRRLNKLIWMNRLPKATITIVEADVIPNCYGITLFDDDFARPVIFLNAASKRWGKTLVHEMVHVSEPTLNHGTIFDALVECYWQRAKKALGGLQ